MIMTLVIHALIAILLQMYAIGMLQQLLAMQLLFGGIGALVNFAFKITSVSI